MVQKLDSETLSGIESRDGSSKYINKKTPERLQKPNSSNKIQVLDSFIQYFHRIGNQESCIGVNHQEQDQSTNHHLIHWDLSLTNNQKADTMNTLYVLLIY